MLLNRHNHGGRPPEKHAVYIKSFTIRCGEPVEGCPIVKKGLHPVYQLTGWLNQIPNSEWTAPVVMPPAER